MSGGESIDSLPLADGMNMKCGYDQNAVDEIAGLFPSEVEMIDAFRRGDFDAYDRFSKLLKRVDGLFLRIAETSLPTG